MSDLLITNEEAIEIAKNQLAKALYDMDTAKNLGLYRIAYNKANWLSKLIHMAESYNRFHWISCDTIMPENLQENVGKKVIPCIVSVKSVYPNGKPNIQKRLRQKSEYTESGWTWSQCKGDRITHWAMLPNPPEV